jgi:hypothetical protein
MVHADEIRAYADRDWDAVAVEKDRFWLEQRARHGVAWAFEMADALRREAVALRPDWPSDAERDADRAVHERVSACLRRVGTNGSR